MILQSSGCEDMDRLELVEHERLILQKRLDSAKIQDERNRLGQFATPPELALEVLKEARIHLRKGTDVRFIDPAFGTGSFCSAFLRVFSENTINVIKGYEIDPHYGVPASELWSDYPVDLHVSDFTLAIPPTTEENKFDLIICNPPYVRHHHISNGNKTRLRSISEESGGFRIGGLAGLYCYFISLSFGWMKKNGIAGWLIPSEFMDVNYGKSLKEYLINKVTLIRIHRFEPNNVQFQDALVSSAVVWFKKTKPSSNHSVEFTLGGTLANPKLTRRIPASVLRDESKWTRFPAASTTRIVKEHRLGDFFSIKRGIATGDNHFFIMTRDQLISWGLSTEYFKPILPSPRHLINNEIRSDERGYPIIEPQLFLLSCNMPEHEVQEKHPNLWRYLQSGKPDVASRYLCSHRSPWYSQEERPPSPFLCTYMCRQGREKDRPFRFILNYSQAIAANVYLALYPKRELSKAISNNPQLVRAIWNALNSISIEMMLEEGRVYGGGLHKLEPKELSNVSANTVADVLKEFVQFQPRQLGIF